MKDKITAKLKEIANAIEAVQTTTKNTEQRPTIRGGNVAATVASPLNSRKNQKARY